MRKIDYYGQFVLLVLILLSCLLYYFNKAFLLLSMTGLFILGIWQIISALTVTFSPRLKIYNRYIRIYWTACIGMLIVFSGAFIFAKYNETTLIYWFIGISTIGGLITAFYYLYLYKNYFLVPVVSELSTPADDGSLLPELEIK